VIEVCDKQMKQLKMKSLPATESSNLSDRPPKNDLNLDRCFWYVHSSEIFIQST